LRPTKLISDACESLPLSGFLSWDCAALQSLGRRRRAQLLVTGHPDIRPRGSAPDVLTCAVAGPRLSPANASLELAFPAEFDRDQAAGTVMEPAASPEVLALSALEETGVDISGVPVPGGSAFRVSHPLGGLLLPNRPGFFHPGGALRVSALRSFPFGDRPASSAVALPACRWLSPSFRVLIPPRVRHQPGRG
jgi:hypothetical protein